MLEVRNLSVRYGAYTALHGVNLVVNSGEIVVLLGANGAGKSSLFRTLSGLQRPSGGDAVYNGETLTLGRPERCVALGVSLLGGGNADNLSRLAFPFYLNVVSFVVVLWVIATLPFPERERGGHRDVLSDIREGLAYVRVTPNIRYTLTLVGLLSLSIINFNVLIPYFARAVYGLREGGFGALNAAFGAGAMVGALWQASRPNPLRNLRLGAVLLPVSGAALALAPGGLLAALVLACCGFSMLTFLISANSTVQLTVPNALRGRVMSLYSLVLVGSAPLGALISSSLIAKGGWLGPERGLLVLVTLAALSVAALWKRLPRKVPRPSSGPD